MNRKEINKIRYYQKQIRNNLDALDVVRCEYKNNEISEDVYIEKMNRLYDKSIVLENKYNKALGLY